MVQTNQLVSRRVSGILFKIARLPFAGRLIAPCALCLTGETFVFVTGAGAGGLFVAVSQCGQPRLGAGKHSRKLPLSAHPRVGANVRSGTPASPRRLALQEGVSFVLPFFTQLAQIHLSFQGHLEAAGVHHLQLQPQALRRSRGNHGLVIQQTPRGRGGFQIWIDAACSQLSFGWGLRIPFS